MKWLMKKKRMQVITVVSLYGRFQIKILWPITYKHQYNCHIVLLYLQHSFILNFCWKYLCNKFFTVNFIYLYIIRLKLLKFLHSYQTDQILNSLIWLHIPLWTKGFINGNLSLTLWQYVIKIYQHTGDQYVNWPELNSMKSSVWSAILSPNLVWEICRVLYWEFWQ